MSRAVETTFVLFLPLTLLLIAGCIVIFDSSLYPYEHAKLGIPLQEAMQYNEDVMHYLRLQSPTIANVPFNAAEIAHLADARSVVVLLLILMGVLVITEVVLAYASVHASKNPLRTLSRILTISGAAHVVLLVFLCVIVLTGLFDMFFNAFHTIFFSPGTWVFPADSLILAIYPYTFFQDALFRICIVSFMLCCAVFMSGATLWFAYHRRW